MRAQIVTIIGLERIGASVGLALKASPLQMTVIGHAANNAQANLAKEKLGAIDKAEWNMVSAASKADIIVLALPMTELESVMKVIGGEIQPHALILDMSSLKGMGLKWAEQHLRRGHYVGVRPILAADMLTDGRSDLEAARADLFQNSVFCLMPSPKADPKAVETAVHFGRVLGASPYFVDPLEYDSLVQGIETMPGLAAAAIFNVIHKAAGWRDILRFADLPFALTTAPLQAGAEITQVALNNKIATLRWLDALIEELQTVRRWLYQGDIDTLTAVLEDAYARRTQWLQERAENNWVEVTTPEVEKPGLSEQLLGSWLGGRRDKE